VLGEDALEEFVHQGPVTRRSHQPSGKEIPDVLERRPVGNRQQFKVVV
jgi:hypothetical protein